MRGGLLAGKGMHMQAWPAKTPLPPALMLQGTCSNAGKSLLTAALCRLLGRRGLKVAPFKAQNMALNSFVTPDGGEMGRAQVLQAAACGLPPDVRMNPVLLKPTSDTGSQVIVLGKPVGRMRVCEYLAYKPKAWKAVRRAYSSLAAGMDVMVLEGAGSPAEINLKAHDIVNMRMARHAGAQVLLVADIDRGGAFAALAGTMSLLGRAERARVAGYILNKFRGDPSLLAPALVALTRRTRRPFFGVVPMIEDLQLPEEDSVNFKSGLTPGLHPGAASQACSSDILDIAVVDLPHISNATDLDALRAEPGVRVRVIRRADAWGRPQAVILPGSRNSIADLRFLQASGLARALRRHAKECLRAGRGALVGICGGLQMLGQSIVDPLGLEEGGKESGLGLLPLRTTLHAAKQLRRVSGQALETVTGARLPVHGYEIHHGQSEPAYVSATAGHGPTFDPDGPLGLRGALVPVMRDAQQRPLGWGLLAAPQEAGEDEPRTRVWGTYLHGVFDADGFRHAFLNNLRRDFKLAPQAHPGRYSLGPELDRLADVVENSLDMPAVLALLDL